MAQIAQTSQRYCANKPPPNLNKDEGRVRRPEGTASHRHTLSLQSSHAQETKRGLNTKEAAHRRDNTRVAAKVAPNTININRYYTQDSDRHVSRGRRPWEGNEDALTQMEKLKHKPKTKGFEPQNELKLACAENSLTNKSNSEPPGKCRIEKGGKREADSNK